MPYIITVGPAGTSALAPAQPPRRCLTLIPFRHRTALSLLQSCDPQKPKIYRPSLTLCVTLSLFSFFFFFFFSSFFSISTSLSPVRLSLIQSLLDRSTLLCSALFPSELSRLISSPSKASLFLLAPAPSPQLPLVSWLHFLAPLRLID